MNAAFDFYDEVIFEASPALPAFVWGTLGVVMGRAEDAAGRWEYAVQAHADAEKCWPVEEGCLRATGRRYSREELLYWRERSGSCGSGDWRRLDQSEVAVDR